MITKTQSKTFKDFLGHNHVQQVQEYLESKGVINRDCNFYSREFISRVLNGNSANRQIEEAIWAFIEQETIARQQLALKREALLEAAQDLTPCEA